MLERHRMQKCTVGLFLLWSFLVLVPTGFAQSDQNSWQNLQQLRVDQNIRIVDKDMKQHDGTFIGFSEEAISLRVGKDEIGITRENVVRVSNRENTHRVRNALIGAAIGGGAGLAVGAGLYPKFKGKFGPPAEYIFLVTGAIGAGGGTAIGAAIPSYQTIYRGQR